jgi:hypothetical protein
MFMIFITIPINFEQYFPDFAVDEFESNPDQGHKIYS